MMKEMLIMLRGEQRGARQRLNKMNLNKIYQEKNRRRKLSLQRLLIISLAAVGGSGSLVQEVACTKIKTSGKTIRTATTLTSTTTATSAHHDHHVHDHLHHSSSATINMTSHLLETILPLLIQRKVLPDEFQSMQRSVEEAADSEDEEDIMMMLGDVLDTDEATTFGFEQGDLSSWVFGTSPVGTSPSAVASGGAPQSALRLC